MGFSKAQRIIWFCPYWSQWEFYHRCQWDQLFQHWAFLKIPPLAFLSFLMELCWPFTPTPEQMHLALFKLCMWEPNSPRYHKPQRRFAQDLSLHLISYEFPLPLSVFWEDQWSTLFHLTRKEDSWQSLYPHISWEWTSYHAHPEQWGLAHSAQVLMLLLLIKPFAAFWCWPAPWW